MLLRHSCPSCQKLLDLPASAPSDGTCRCPHCHALFSANEGSTAAPEATQEFEARAKPGNKDVDRADPTPYRGDAAPVAPEVTVNAKVNALETIDVGPMVADGSDMKPVRPARFATTLPARIGRFDIRRELGEGAFGKVYEAYDSQLDRAVALKVAKIDRGDSAQRVKRFLREAKAAANLRHPHIVPLYEYGQDGDQFYIAVAFIRGTTLADDLLTRGGAPDLDRGVRLIRQLAEALAYAHSQGIVHRDVKPANTMLDERDEPMLLDFGLATRQDEADKITHVGQIVGTPRYMAPEQARGKSASAGPACDQYSLGVMLFELITGKQLFEGAAELVIVHHVETEPPRPRSFNAAVPRDLETICLKCLEKDPERRYASALDLAEDLRRFQAGEPIRARRIGTLERVIKWSRRNRGVACLTGAVAMLLVVSTLLASWLALWALNEASRADAEAGKAKTSAAIALENEKKAKDSETSATASAKNAIASARVAKENEKKANDALADAQKQRKAADAEKRRAERVREFLASLFISNDPTGLTGVGLLPAIQAGKELTARQLMEHGRKSIDKLEADPLTQAALLDTIGDVSRSLGEFEQSLPLLERAHEIRKKHLAPDHIDLATSLLHLGNWFSETGYVDKAEVRYLEALAIHQKRGSMDTAEGAETQLRYAALLVSIGDEPTATQWARAGYEARLKLFDSIHRETTVGRFVLLAALLDEGSYAEAAPLAAEAITFLQQAGRKEKGGVLEAISDYQSGMLTMSLGFHEAAEGSLRAAVTNLQKNLGKEHVYAIIPLSDLGACLEKQGKQREAEAALREAVEITRKALGLGHPRARILVERYADLLVADKRDADAMAVMEEMLTSQEERFDKSFRWRLRTLAAVGEFAAKHGKVQRAEELAGEVVTLLGDRSTPLARADVVEIGNLANALGRAGDMKLVSSLYREFLQHLARAPDRRDLLQYANYGFHLTARGQHAEALAFLNKTLTDGKDGSARDMSDIHDSIGMAHWSLGEFVEAERSMLRAAEFDLHHAHRLVVFYVQRGRYTEALEYAQKYHGTKIGAIDKAWCVHQETLLRHLLGTLDANAMGAKLNGVSFANKYADAASYRARAFASMSIPAAQREEEALKQWFRASPVSAHPVVARALCQSRAGKDSDVVSGLKDLPKKVPLAVRHLHDTLNCLAQYRLDPTPSKRSALTKALDVGENYLVARMRLKNPRVGGYVASAQLDLAWLCASLRTEYFDSILDVQGSLAVGAPIDRVVKHPAQVHEVQLEAGHEYVIDMKSPEFDTFLRLEDSAKEEIGKDDDGGGDLHARIVVRPTVSGAYRIIATNFNGKTGAYHLRVLRAKS